MHGLVVYANRSTAFFFAQRLLAKYSLTHGELYSCYMYVTVFDTFSFFSCNIPFLLFDFTCRHVFRQFVLMIIYSCHVLGLQDGYLYFAYLIYFHADNTIELTDQLATCSLNVRGLSNTMKGEKFSAGLEGKNTQFTFCRESIVPRKRKHRGPQNGGIQLSLAVSQALALL